MLRQIILFSREANMQSNSFISYSLFSRNALSLFNSLARDQYIGYIAQVIMGLEKLSSHVKQVYFPSPSFYTLWYLIFVEKVEFIMPKLPTQRVKQAPSKYYSIPMGVWSHESSHLHYLCGFCTLGSAFNTSFLDGSPPCPFCWAGLLLLRQVLQTFSCHVRSE